MNTNGVKTNSPTFIGGNEGDCLVTDLNKNESTRNKIKINENPKHNSFMKWVVLICSCMTLLGNYYCFDSPGALKSLLKVQFQSSSQNFEYFFSMLYSLYSIPNIFLPLIGGVLILKLGNRFMYILCASFIVIGQLVFVLGVVEKNQNLALLGRLIFGLGGETINTTQSVLIFDWFPPNQITLAFGVSLSFARFSSVLNDYFSPKIATANDIGTALWIGFTLCVFSLIVTMFLVHYDWKEMLRIRMKAITNDDYNEEGENLNEEDDSFSFDKMLKLNKVYFFFRCTT